MTQINRIHVDSALSMEIHVMSDKTYKVLIIDEASESVIARRFGSKGHMEEFCRKLGGLYEDLAFEYMSMQDK